MLAHARAVLSPSRRLTVFSSDPLGRREPRSLGLRTGFDRSFDLR